MHQTAHEELGMTIGLTPHPRPRGGACDDFPVSTKLQPLISACLGASGSTSGWRLLFYSFRSIFVTCFGQMMDTMHLAFWQWKPSTYFLVRPYPLLTSSVLHTFPVHVTVP